MSSARGLPPEQKARLRRRWPFVVACTVVVGALLWFVSWLGGTPYLSRSALELISTTNTPGEESVLAQGYADFFNQPSTQQGLRRQGGVDASVVLTARVAAASPILYVEATAAQPHDAEVAARGAATAFRAEVDRSLVAATPTSRASSRTAGSTRLEVLRLDAGTAALPSDRTRSIAPPVETTAVVSTLAAMFVPDRRRRPRALPAPASIGDR